MAGNKPNHQSPTQTPNEDGDTASPTSVTGNNPDFVVPQTLIATTRIDICNRIGRGGLGDVYAGIDKSTGRTIAVKFLNEGAMRQEVCRKSFEFEATVTSQLEHPNIVPVYSTGGAGASVPFYAMRLISGKTLGAAIAEFHDQGHGAEKTGPGKALQLGELLGNFIAICNAIAYSHDRGVIHRDIKPSNVMMGKFGEVIVLDWGLAARIDRSLKGRSSGEDSILMPTRLVSEQAIEKHGHSGTPAYMSPEQHDGARPVGTASDVYGLGATLYHLLTGQPPFDGDVVLIRERVLAGKVVAPSRVRKGIPKTIEAVCLKAMALDPADRYNSPLDLADDVRRHLADHPVSALRDGLVAKAGRWARQHQTLTRSVLVVMVFMVLIGWTASFILQQANSDLSKAQQSVIGMTGRLAASTAAQQIELRKQVLIRESKNPSLVAALGKIAGNKTADGAKARDWHEVQVALAAISEANRGEVNPESWMICDSTGRQLARVPEHGTIGDNFRFRDYFHGGGRNLEEDAKPKPIQSFNLSRVFRSKATGTLKVCFSYPIWGVGGGSGDDPIGVLGMTFNLGDLFDSFEELGKNFVILVVDLREGNPGSDGATKGGWLVLENQEQYSRANGADLPRFNPRDISWAPGPARVIAEILAGQKLDTDLVDWLVNHQKRRLALRSNRSQQVVKAEPIQIRDGRNEKPVDTGWAVLLIDTKNNDDVEE